MADGGNQTMVEVGSGVSVAVEGGAVPAEASSGEQEVRINVIARRLEADKVIPRRNRRLPRRFAPRNDVR